MARWEARVGRLFWTGTAAEQAGRPVEAVAAYRRAEEVLRAAGFSPRWRIASDGPLVLELREARALEAPDEVATLLVAAGTRWALLHEVVGPEPDLPELLARMQPVDLVLVEGYKSHPFPKLEVHRPALGKPPIWPGQPDIVAVASDAPVTVDRVLLPLNDPAVIAGWILEA